MMRLYRTQVRSLPCLSLTDYCFWILLNILKLNIRKLSKSHETSPCSHSPIPRSKALSFKELVEFGEVNACPAFKAIEKFCQDHEAKIWSRLWSRILLKKVEWDDTCDHFMGRSSLLYVVVMRLLCSYYGVAMLLLCGCYAVAMRLLCGC